MKRKNINRGFKKLRVWQDAVSLYILASKIFANFPFELKKVAANGIDAAHSISRNISEGYCRRSLKEYLNHLNFALGSCGEFHSCYVSCKQAGQRFHSANSAGSSDPAKQGGRAGERAQILSPNELHSMTWRHLTVLRHIKEFSSKSQASQ